MDFGATHELKLPERVYPPPNYLANFSHDYGFSFAPYVLTIVAMLIVRQLMALKRRQRRVACAPAETGGEPAHGFPDGPSGEPIPHLLAVTSKEAAAATIRKIVPETSRFVLFWHGTFVTLDGALDDLETAALAVIEEDDPVIPGGWDGDFDTHELKSGMGYLVSGHSDRLFTFISPKQLTGPRRHPFEIGLFGRHMRSLDAEERRIIHMRPPTAA